jgi:hypothetical protein
MTNQLTTRIDLDDGIAPGSRPTAARSRILAFAAAVGSQSLAFAAVAQPNKPTKTPILDPAKECPACPEAVPCPDVNPILDPAEECPACPEAVPCPDVNPILDPAVWIGVLVGAVVGYGAMRLFGKK